MTNQQSSNSLIRHSKASELLIQQSTTGYKPTQFQFSSHHNLSPCFSKISLLDVVNQMLFREFPNKILWVFPVPTHQPQPPMYTTYPLHLWSHFPNTTPSAKIIVSCYVRHSNKYVSLKDGDILQSYTTNAKIIVSSHDHQCFVGQTKTSNCVYLMIQEEFRSICLVKGWRETTIMSIMFADPCRRFELAASQK